MTRSQIVPPHEDERNILPDRVISVWIGIISYAPTLSEEIPLFLYTSSFISLIIRA